MLRGKQGLPAERHWCVSSAFFVPALIVFIVATRWSLAPKYLYYFDSANFALALHDFNPALHQPQPPGYALFVALTRVIHLLVPQPERILLIAGLLAACAATLLIRTLAAEMFGCTAGVLAAALLASNPVLWFAGITNEVRTFLSLCAVGIALLAWRAFTRPERPAWFYGTFAALGIAAGFRPVLATLLIPLLLWVWVRNGHSVRRLAIAFTLLATTALPWLAVTMNAVGGPRPMLDMLWAYASDQFGGSSALFGASSHSAYKMFVAAVVWNSLGLLVWIWAVPFLKRLRTDSGWRDKATFLAFCFFPPFLFSAFVHIGDPDQALASVSILCVVGGAALGAVASGRWRLIAMATTVVIAQAILFFYPPGRLARASSYRAAAAVDRINSGALNAIHALRLSGPVTIVHYGSAVTPRHLSYYFPDDYVNVLPGIPGQAAPAEGAQLFFQREPLSIPSGTGGLIRTGSQRIICLLPANAKASTLPGWKTKGPVFYKDARSGKPVEIGPFTLVPEGM